MRATEILVNEHEVILQVLGCLERLADRAESQRTMDVPRARQALDFLVTFADRCHHGKEEQALFVALEQRGLPKQAGPLAVMLSEHEQGRAAIARMGAATEAAEQGQAQASAQFANAARGYVALLRDHIDKENEVLFPMADQMLDARAQEGVLARFASIESVDMGAGTHERYLDLAKTLCAELGVSWSAPKAAAGACCGHHAPAR
jgi:hemerythrin-like domain-containing protein